MSESESPPAKDSGTPEDAPDTTPQEKPPPESDQQTNFAVKQDNQWLLTYTDLVSLILTFFVLLFSMSSLPTDNWKVITTALSRSDLPPEEDIVDKEKEELTVDSKTLQASLNLDYLSALLETQFAKTGNTKEISLHHFGDQLVVSLPSDLLFTVASARLSKRGQATISDVSGVLRNLDNRVDIFGHADPDPITGGPYNSNWELSLARALTVADQLQRSGYIGDINAYGAASSHFSFISPRIEFDKRKELARRVDIIISSKSRLQE